MSPLEAVAIRAGHRELLETLRELLAEPVDLRATLAFLRQSVVPFARREERLLRSELEAWEGAAFDHAFLEAEIDRLGREMGEEGASLRVRRTLWRIEAALELHVLREDDRGVRVPA